MNINANELLLLNRVRNLKFRGEEPTQPQAPVALAEVPESTPESTMNALNQQGMNNIAFQGRLSMATVRNGLMSALVVASALGFQSCQDEPYFVPGGETIITNNVEVNVTMSNEAILAELQKLNGNMDAILQVLLDAKLDLTRIIGLLESMGFNIETIAQLLVQNGQKADVIIELLQTNNDKQDIIINTLTKGNEEYAALLNRVLVAVEKGNKLSESNNQLLTLILQAINKLDSNDQKSNAILMAIFNKLVESMEQNKQMHEEDQAIFNAILTAVLNADETMKNGFINIINKMDSLNDSQKKYLILILNKITEMQNDNKFMHEEDKRIWNALINAVFSMDQNMQAGINEILAKMDQLSADQKVYVAMILEKMDQMRADDRKYHLEIMKRIDKLGNKALAMLNKILKAIENGNKISADTYKLLLQMLDNQEKLGEKADTIINLLGEMSLKGADLTNIEKYLQEILKSSQDNGSKLDNMNERVKFLQESVKVLMDVLPEYKDLLQKILDKIPPGCNCTQTDLTEIIKILIEIRDKSTGSGNEGIIEDLEDLLG